MTSDTSTVKVFVGEDLLAKGTVRALQPFERSMVRLVCEKKLPAGSEQAVTVLLESEDAPTEFFTRKVSVPK